MSERRFSASKYPLRFTAGEDYTKAFNYYPDGLDADPQDWDGWEGAAQLRRKADSSATIATFTVTLGSEGLVRLSLSADSSEGLEGRAVYDVKLTDGSGSDTVLFGGPVTIAAAVTR